MPDLTQAEVAAMVSAAGLPVTPDDLVEVTHRLNAFLGAAPTIAESPSAVKSREDGAGKFFTRRAYSAPAALAGVPAVAVPCGFDPAGLPLSLQLLGRPFEDATVLRAAHAYEQATEWHRRRPALDAV